MQLTSEAFAFSSSVRRSTILTSSGIVNGLASGSAAAVTYWTPAAATKRRERRDLGAILTMIGCGCGCGCKVEAILDDESGLEAVLVWRRTCLRRTEHLPAALTLPLILLPALARPDSASPLSHEFASSTHQPPTAVAQSGLISEHTAPNSAVRRGSNGTTVHLHYQRPDRVSAPSLAPFFPPAKSLNGPPTMNF